MKPSLFFPISIFFISVMAGNAQNRLFREADSLYSLGNYAQAIQKLENIHPKTENTYLQLAKNYKANGNSVKALQNYRTLVKTNPKRVITALNYGKLLLSSGHFKQADSLFEILSKDYPKNAQFQYQRGLAQESLKDSLALKFYKKAIHYDKYFPKALYKLAEDALKHRRYKEATKLSKQGLDRHPNNSPLLSILAQSEMATQDYHKAIENFKKLIQLGKENEFIVSKLGYANYQIFNYKDAICYYKKALSYDAKNAATHYALGKLYARNGDLQKSEEHLKAAILLRNPVIDAEYLSLGITYKLQKNYKSALEYFNKSLEENPNNQRALYERAVAADNYFKDLQSKIDYYKAYLHKYEKTGMKPIIRLSKNRISDLKAELHQSTKNNAKKTKS